MSALQVIETKLAGVWHQFDGEAKAALKQALADARAEAAKLEAEGTADAQKARQALAAVKPRVEAYVTRLEELAEPVIANVRGQILTEGRTLLTDVEQMVEQALAQAGGTADPAGDHTV